MAREMDETRRLRRVSWGTWAPGAVLILLGVVFLVQNYTGYALGNWWAFFILIPAVFSFASAYETHERAGRLTSAASRQIVGGLFLTAIAAIFLLELPWGRVWPIFLVLAGLALLLNRRLSD